MACFVAGTLIATPLGEIPVEELRPRDKVITRDNGVCEVDWTQQRVFEGAELKSKKHLQPILMQKGCLGGRLPENDLVVSPNQRVLAPGDRSCLFYERDEVLIAAKHLINPSLGIQQIQSFCTTYVGLLFDRHQSVLANGAWVESFQPYDRTLDGLGNAQRNEFFEIFPNFMRFTPKYPSNRPQSPRRRGLFNIA